MTLIVGMGVMGAALVAVVAGYVRPRASVSATSSQDLSLETSTADPEWPSHAIEAHARALNEARLRNERRPGRIAFRTMVNAFLEHNRAALEAQAERQGMTPLEIEELTHLGFLVQRSQHWDDVERWGGRAPPEARATMEEFMMDLDVELRTRMQEMVETGVPAADRLRAAHEVERRYFDRYRELIGMDDARFDELLADSGGHPSFQGPDAGAH